MNVLVALLLLLVSISQLFSFEIDPVLQNCTTRGEAIEEISNENRTVVTLKCFQHCLLENANIIANGKIVISDLSTMNLTLDGTERAKLCLDIKDENRCELGHKLFTCLQEPIK